MNKANSLKAFAAGLALTAAAVTSTPAFAEMDCRINIEITKGGFVIGVSGGSGTLTCDGKRYALSVGGMSAGLVIGASRVSLSGEVNNLHSIRDIEGTYTGLGASAAIGGGGSNVLAKNAKGVQLVMQGTQAGLEGSLDLGGTVIKLK